MSPTGVEEERGAGGGGYPFAGGGWGEGGSPFLTRRAVYMAGVVGSVPGKGSYVAGKAV